MIFWRKDVNVVLHSYSEAHIDVGIPRDDGTQGWRFTGIYGHPEAARRGKMWGLFQTPSGKSVRPWIYGGDFNKILQSHEKLEYRRLDAK
ncbi:UNVERIFIED_CONTAM: hypothetical protein Slati_0154500 [Sesamum latifolium]|uniref:Uncharacterized protein n=1 Tax=Sesamum latifolium TaxID=2727402 RepID=A0AAW2YA52_9LAMI